MAVMGAGIWQELFVESINSRETSQVTTKNLIKESRMPYAWNTQLDLSKSYNGEIDLIFSHRFDIDKSSYQRKYFVLRRFHWHRKAENQWATV